MSKIELSALILFLCLSSRVAIAQNLHLDAIRSLGKLNGVALQCGFFDQTRLMKQVLVEVLPKRRSLGQAFDQATHDSYLSFTENKRRCPTQVELMLEVNESMRHLRQVYSER